MRDQLEMFGLGRYFGNQQAPIGTFVNMRTMEYFQQASDGVLPADGDFVLISTNATLTAAQVATQVNTLIGTTFTAGNFHAHAGGDLATSQGTGANDA